MCGTFNGKKSDDYATPLGLPLDNVADFGNSWRKKDIRDSSALDVDPNQAKIHTCQKLMVQVSFISIEIININING